MKSAASADYLPPNVNHTLGEVHVIPTKAKNLPAAQPIGKQEREGCMQWVAPSGLQEPACLVN